MLETDLNFRNLVIKCYSSIYQGIRLGVMIV